MPLAPRWVVTPLINVDVERIHFDGTVYSSGSRRPFVAFFFNRDLLREPRVAAWLVGRTCDGDDKFIDMTSTRLMSAATGSTSRPALATQLELGQRAKIQVPNRPDFQ